MRGSELGGEGEQVGEQGQGGASWGARGGRHMLY